MISRAGRVPTGVDRVERAYLRYLLSKSMPLFGLVRTTLGYVLLDKSGLVPLLQRVDGHVAWGSRDALSWAARKKSDTVQRAESDLRRFALARSLARNAGRMLARHVPSGAEYLNIGHSNLNDRTFWAVRRSLNARISVFIHDTIPLDHPQFQRSGTPELFHAKLKRVQRFADRIVCNSSYTRDRLIHHMTAWGDIPDIVVAHLGVDIAEPDPSGLPDGLDTTRPYFVTVGTIEPRKRHGLLLDVWEDLVADQHLNPVPPLLICGSRGWNNDAVFDRLDNLPPDMPVHELSGLRDGAVSALVQGACALLFPSEVEGYGLPPIEAACLGTPVICRDLPVYRESLNDIPVYLTAADRYLLIKLVQSLLNGPEAERAVRSSPLLEPPTWEDHFSLVFGVE